MRHTARGQGGIAWHYVRGHSGIPGNERVDAIADGLARGLPITFPGTTGAPRAGKRPRPTAYRSP